MVLRTQATMPRTIAPLVLLGSIPTRLNRAVSRAARAGIRPPRQTVLRRPARIVLLGATMLTAPQHPRITISWPTARPALREKLVSTKGRPAVCSARLVLLGITLRPETRSAFCCPQASLSARSAPLGSTPPQVSERSERAL